MKINLRHLLLFIGISSVQIISAQQLVLKPSWKALDTAGIEYLKSVEITGLSLPTTGASQSWDYSSLKDSDNYDRSYYQQLKIGAATNAQSREYLMRTSFAGLSLKSKVFRYEDSTGLYETGRGTDTAYQDISSTTNTKGDYIAFPTQTLSFGGKGLTTIPYPGKLGFSTTWSGAPKSVYFILNAHNIFLGLNYTKAKGEIRSIITQHTSVVGYGKLKLKTNAALLTLTEDVVLVRMITTNQDSFFADGKPIGALVLSALQAKQGQKSVTAKYSFQRTGTTVPLFSINALDSNFSYVSSAFVDTTGLRYTDVCQGYTAIQNSTFRIYPNPATASSIINLSFPVSSDFTGNMIISDMQGRSVFRSDRQSFTPSNSRIELPVLASGSYQIVITNQATGIRYISTLLK